MCVLFSPSQEERGSGKQNKSQKRSRKDVDGAPTFEVVPEAAARIPARKTGDSDDDDGEGDGDEEDYEEDDGIEDDVDEDSDDE